MIRPRKQNPFKLLDPEFRVAVVLAQAAAKRSGSPEINHHHILVGLLADPAGRASSVLAAAGADIDTLNAELRERIGPVNPSADRPRLGADAATAIRAAYRQARTATELINTAHLLVGLAIPLSGWGRAALKKAGVSRRALRSAYKSGKSDAMAGLDPAAVDWVWEYLPQSGRLVAVGDQAQAAGDLPAAIDAFERALAAAQEDFVVSGAAGDIYPRLIQANLLTGDFDRAVTWLDEADGFLETYEFRPGPVADAPDTADFRDFLADIEQSMDVVMQDLRLQLLKDRAQIALGRDKFGDLETTARKLIETANELQHANAVAAGRHLLGLALAYQGTADDAAEQHLRASLEPPELIDPVDVASRTHSLASLALMRGNHTEALRLAEEAQALYSALGLQRSVIVTRLTQAEAQVASGGELTPRLVEDAEGMDPDGRAELLGWVWRIEAASLRTSRPAAALESIDQAIAVSREHGHNLLLLRCLLEQGRILHAMHRDQPARLALEEANRLADALGVRFGAEARRQLDALGSE